jgi:hypothetical protein
LGVPLLVRRIDAGRRTDEARQERYDELRSVLDDASITIVHVWQLEPGIEDLEGQPDLQRGQGEVASIAERLARMLEWAARRPRAVGHCSRLGAAVSTLFLFVGRCEGVRPASGDSRFIGRSSEVSLRAVAWRPISLSRADGDQNELS